MPGSVRYALPMHVVTTASPPTLSRSGHLAVHAVPMAKDNLGWLLVAGDEACAIDGPEAAPVLRVCRELGVRLTTVLNTHTHPDHIGINRELLRYTPELAALGAPDPRLAGALTILGPAAVAGQIPGLTHGVEGGQTITFAGHQGQVLTTEGHLEGHVSFVFEDLAFTGDSLFTGGCGYLFTGPPAAMHEGLARLAALPADTWIFCAHEYTEDNLRFALTLEPDNRALRERVALVEALRHEGRATVPERLAVELETNPFLRGHSTALVASLGRALPELPLTTPVEIFAATRRLKDLRRYREA